MRYLVVEYIPSGHRLVYLRLLAEHILRTGHEVILGVSAEVLESAEFKLHLGKFPGNVQTSVTQLKPLHPRKLRQWGTSLGADHVIVPDGDIVAIKAGLSLQKKSRVLLTALVMRDPRWESPASFLRTLKGRFKYALLHRAERGGTRIVWLREPLFVEKPGELAAVDPFISTQTWRTISENAAALRIALKMDHDTFWFGVTGAISRRKNLPLVVDALSELARRNPNLAVGLAVVGGIAPDAGVSKEQILERLESEGIACVVADALITNDEMNAVVQAMDAVVMAYSTHSPNSTLGKAYVLGTRLVAAGPPSIRTFARNVGAFQGPLSVDALAANFQRAMASERPQPHHDALSASDFSTAVVGKT